MVEMSNMVVVTDHMCTWIVANSKFYLILITLNLNVEVLLKLSPHLTAVPKVLNSEIILSIEVPWA